MDQDTPLPSNPDDVPTEAGYDSGDNSEVSATAFVQDPVLTKYQTEEYQQKWIEELDASKKERQKYVTKGYKILAHWADKRDKDGEGRSNYNLLFANTEMKKSALYARTPEPDIKRRFNDPDDQVSRVAALILSRKIQYELAEENFDDTFESILMDRLLPGMGVGWLRLAQIGGEELVDPQTLQPAGQTEITHQETPIDHVSWDDFLWSPCRTWKLCRWVARRVSMSKAAVKDRFGESAPAAVLDQLSYEKEKEKDNSKDGQQQLRTKNTVESTTDIYEIWDKELRLVWWVSESADCPLDVQEDVNEFPGFFPTPIKPLGRFDGSNTLPYPDYHFVQDLYRMLDEVANRAAKAIQAAVIKFAFSSKNKALADILKDTMEFEGVPVDDWAGFGEDGGLAQSMQFLPIDMFTKTANELYQTLDVIKQQILQIEGLSGPFQGESVPNETIVQTQQKAAFGTSRLSVTQKEAAKYCENLLKLKAHLICKFYTPPMILQGTGTLTPDDQALIPQALQLLKNEQLRNFNLVVSVDSIQLPNWNLQLTEKTEAFKAIMQTLQQTLPALQTQPELLPMALESVKWLITGFKGAQFIEGALDKGLQQVELAIKQKANKPPQPTPEQLKAQQAQQKNQTDLQIASWENETKQALAAIQARLDAMDMQLRARSQQVEEQKVGMELHDQAKNTVHDHAVDIASLPLNAPVAG